MPELPEVETIRRQLSKTVVGKKIKEIKVLRVKSFQGLPEELEGKTVERVERKSKVIEFYFKNYAKMLICHLKMTGQLVYVDQKMRVAGGHPTADWIGELPSKHTRIIWDFSDGAKLFFNDMRVFGWMKIVEMEKYHQETRKQVPDVIDEHFTVKYLKEVLVKAKKAIKLVLLDQDKMGGMGNIYVNDALYLAGIRPDRKANEVKENEVRKLYKAMKEVIEKGIKYGGASAANYVDLQGMGGSYQEHFLVYKNDGQMCPKSNGVIKKMKLGGRGTFYCEKCQK